MAEAVGLVASIATLAKIVVKTGELTLTYKHAPRELQVLKSGLIGLDSDLRRLEEFCKKVPERKNVFETILAEANGVLTETLGLVNQASGTNSQKPSAGQRLKFAASTKSRVVELIDQLRMIQERIHTRLMQEAVSSGYDAEVAITQLETNFTQWQQDSRAEHARFYEEVIENQTEMRALQTREFELLREKAERMESKINTLQIIQPVGESQDPSTTLTKLLSAAAELIQNPHAMKLLEQPVSEDFMALSLRQESKQAKLRSATKGISLGISNPNTGLKGHMESTEHTRPYIVRCACQCHNVFFFKSPSVLTPLIGQLHVSLKGSIFSGCVCASKRCKNRGRSAQMQVAYSTPLTFARKMYIFNKRLGIYGNPEAPWSVRNVISYGNSAYFDARNGHVDRLKYLFSTGAARPTDCDTAGNSLSVIALMNSHINAFQFLYQLEANAHSSSSSGRTFIDVVWELRMKRNEGKGWRLLDLSFLPASFNPSEEWELTALHEAILGLDPELRVRDIIKATTDIDELDARGRTALWWASWCGEWEMVRLLLEHGADPNKADCFDDYPLHGIAKDAPLDLLDEILRYGANPASVNSYGRTALHNVRNQRERVELLIKAGAELDTLDHSGSTPLMDACQQDKNEVLLCLIEHGVDPGKFNVEYGMTPLHVSVFYNSHQTLRILLNRGVDCRRINTWGESLFMIACARSDIATIDILSEYGVGRDFDPLHANSDGHTIFSYHWIPFNCTRANRLYAMLRLLASGHCTQCTDDARHGRPAARGGCPHGVLLELGLQDKIDKMELYLDEDSDDYSYMDDCDLSDVEDEVNTKVNEETMYEGVRNLFINPLDEAKLQLRKEEEEEEEGLVQLGSLHDQHQNTRADALDSEDDEEEFVEAQEWVEYVY